MKKEVLSMVLCGVLVGCGASSPTPSTAPASSTTPTSSNIRKDLDASRIKIESKLDVDAMWRALTIQREVAKKYRTRKNMCEALKANGSSECGENPECTSRIEPSCNMCHGGPLICIPKGTTQEQGALGTEQGMLQCLAQSDTAWHIYSRSKKVSVDETYQTCVCAHPSSSVYTYVAQGFVTPHPEAGKCLSERASCLQQGHQFQGARLLGVVSPDMYDAYGLTVRLDTRFKQCNVQTRRPSKAAKDDVFRAFANAQGTCSAYRFKGYEQANHDNYGDHHERWVIYQVHSCTASP